MGAFTPIDARSNKIIIAATPRPLLPTATSEFTQVAGSARKPSSRRILTIVSLLSADFLALCAAIGAAGLLSSVVSTQLLHTHYYAFSANDLQQRLINWLCLFAGLCCWFGATGAYTARRPLQEDLKRIVGALTVMLMIDGFVEFLSAGHFSRLWVLLVWPISIIIIPLARISARRVLETFGVWRIGAAVIGSGSHYNSVAELLDLDSYVGYAVAYHTKIVRDIDAPLPQLAQTLARDMRMRGAETAILVPSAAELPTIDRVIDALNLNLLPYVLIPPVQSLPIAGLTVHTMINSGAIMMTSRNGLLSPMRRALKRLFDIVVASLLIVLLFPALLLICGLVAATGGPIVYGHKRVGQGNRPFRCLKFRSMAVNSEQILAELLARDPAAAREWRQNFKLTHDPRITTIGRFLRKTSLDELPQLINVLRGEMSLVGPRPVVADELRYYYGEDAFYYSLVRPGITGLWQVSGRSQTTYERRVFLDTCYVRNWSLWTDLLILLNTVPSVLLSRGAH